MGPESLKKNPNPDTDGFVACNADQQREGKYELRAEIDGRNRQVIREGRKAYDTVSLTDTLSGTER